MLTTELDRRRFLIGASTTVLATHARPSLAQSDSFVVATFGGTYERQLIDKNLLAEFNAANSVEAQLEFGVGSTFIQKMLASPMRSPFSLIYLNEDEAADGVDANLFAPPQPERLENAGRIYETLMPPNVEMYGASIGELACVYNSNRMDEPKSWEDLWKPGIRVGVCHPSVSYGLFFLMIAAELADSRNLVDAIPQIKKLDKYILYRGAIEGLELFRRDEIDVALYHRKRHVQLVEEGFPMRFAIPAEGSFGLRTGMQVARNGAREDLAFKWIDAVLSDEWQRALAEGPLYNSPSNKMVELPPELADKHIYGNEEVGKLRFLDDWRAVNAQKPDLLGQWDREFAI